jgi:Flp pilus assembly protein TadD
VIPTATRLRYATGYLELGLTEAAARELRAIEPAEQEEGLVQQVWIELHMAAGEWTKLIPVAQRITASEPDIERPWIALAYALRELKRVEEARRTLLAAEPLHGTSGLLHYNLACYECLLGDLEEARRRLARAYRLEPKLQPGAAEDPDLARLQLETKRA